MKPKSPVGRFILDGGKLGIVTNEISSTNWNNEPFFSWNISYEIKFYDGVCCIMTKPSFERLVDMGRIIFLDGEKK